MKAAEETLESIVIKRPRLQKYRLCCSIYVLTKKGYDFHEIEWEVVIVENIPTTHTSQM
jgi:hypothetical protein